MQRVLIAVVLILTAGLATWFWQQQSDPVLPVTIKPKPVTPAEPALSPIQKAAPVLDLKGEPIAPQDQAKAIAHIETITPPEKTPINVGKAQHFVTADQLLELPIKQIQTDAALEALAEAERADTTAVESVLQTLAPSVTGTATATTNNNHNNQPSSVSQTINRQTAATCNLQPATCNQGRRGESKEERRQEDRQTDRQQHSLTHPPTHPPINPFMVFIQTLLVS